MSQYFNTAERMYKSSKILHDNKQFFNACYLAGYVVECFQKTVIEILNQDPKKIHDLEDLKRQYKSLKATRRGQDLAKKNLFVDIESKFPTIFSVWHPTHRYDDSYTWTEESSIKFQEELKHCLHLLNRLKTNGYIKL